MADSRFVEICEPAATAFLRDRHDPATVTALKIQVLTDRMCEALAEWQEKLADPQCKYADTAAEMVRTLEAKLGTDQQGEQSNGR